MTRLTITLSDERHRALKEAALKRHKSIASLIDESLDFFGIKTQNSASALVAQARERAGLSQEKAIELAVNETRSARKP